MAVGGVSAAKACGCAPLSKPCGTRAPSRDACTALSADGSFGPTRASRGSGGRGTPRAPIPRKSRPLRRGVLRLGALRLRRWRPDCRRRCVARQRLPHGRWRLLRLLLLMLLLLLLLQLELLLVLLLLLKEELLLLVLVQLLRLLLDQLLAL